MRFWRAGLLLGGLVVAGVALRSVGFEGGVAAAGQRGPIVFLLVASVACAVGVPRQVIAYAGGLAFGFWVGAALALIAEVVACVADFAWARLVARAWAERRIRGRLARLDQALAAQPFAATLSLRLLPVGNNLLLNLAAGLSAVPLAPFVAASALGYVPQTVVFALLGGGVRVEQTTQVIIAAALFAVSSALGVWLLRRRRFSAGA